MSDLISRQAAIEAIEEMQIPIMRSIFPEEQFVFKGMSEALSAIKELPSAQPDIIRCKDCEYYELTEWVAHRCNLLGRSVYGNDFCAWAEPYKGEQE